MLHVGRSDGVLAPVFESGIAREIARMFTKRGPFTEKRKDHEVVSPRVLGCPLQRIDDVLMGRRLTRPLRIGAAQKQANMLGIDAQIVFVCEQIIKGLRICFRVRPRQNLRVGILGDPDENHVRLAGWLGCGKPASRGKKQ